MRPSRALRFGGILDSGRRRSLVRPWNRQERCRTRDALHGEPGSTLARVAASARLWRPSRSIALAMFGGGDGYKVKAVFQNAGQLVRGNAVQVGGGQGRHGQRHRAGRQRPGRRDAWRWTTTSRRCTRGPTATIRATSLSGIANRYVSLQPGPEQRRRDRRRRARSAPTRRARRWTSTRSSTRWTSAPARACRNVIRGYGDRYDGKGERGQRRRQVLQPVPGEHDAT